MPRSLTLLGSGNAGAAGSSSSALDLYTTGLTGAWSMGRKLLTAYGGSFYTDTGGTVSTLFDQSGSARNFTAGVGARPAVGSMGGRTAADFTPNTHVMQSNAISDFINNNSGFIVWLGTLDTFVTTQSTLIHDLTHDNMSMAVITSSQRAQAYNFDGSTDVISGAATAVTTGTPHVITWRHEGGSLFCSVNGGSEVSVASGNTSTISGFLRLGRSTSLGFDGKFEELYIWDAVPSSGDRTAIIAQAKTYAGI